MSHAQQTPARDTYEYTTGIAPGVAVPDTVESSIGVVIWVFGKKRKARFDRDSRLPLEDGDEIEKDKD